MCILIKQPADYAFTEAHLQDFYAKNPDGFGAMIKTNEGVEVIKTVGSLKEITELYYDRVACFEAVIHFRWKTHGDIDLENCHPYEVCEGLWMAHNGVLGSGNAEDPTKSDTWHYIKNYLRPLLQEHPDLLKRPEFRAMLGSHIGSSNKFGFMNQQGESFIINPNSGLVHDGVWFSNTYAWTPWKFGYGTPPAPVKSYYGTGTTHYSTGKSYKSYDDWYEERQMPLPLSGKAKAKPKSQVKREKQIREWNPQYLETAQIKRLIRSCYKNAILSDYNQALTWIEKHPKMAMNFLWELYGNNESDSWNADAIADLVQDKPVEALDIINEIWAEMEEELCEMAGIEMGNLTKEDGNETVSA